MKKWQNRAPLIILYTVKRSFGAKSVGISACGFWDLNTCFRTELHSQPTLLSLPCALITKIKTVNMKTTIYTVIFIKKVTLQICFVNSTPNYLKSHFSNVGFFLEVYKCTIVLSTELRFQKSQWTTPLFFSHKNIICKRKLSTSPSLGNWPIPQ